jgi:hypothetical protein
MGNSMVEDGLCVLILRLFLFLGLRVLVVFDLFWG